MRSEDYTVLSGCRHRYKRSEGQFWFGIFTFAIYDKYKELSGTSCFALPFFPVVVLGHSVKVLHYQLHLETRFLKFGNKQTWIKSKKLLLCFYKLRNNKKNKQTKTKKKSHKTHLLINFPFEGHCFQLCWISRTRSLKLLFAKNALKSWTHL